jgi:hypothetical protein
VSLPFLNPVREMFFVLQNSDNTGYDFSNNELVSFSLSLEGQEYFGVALFFTVLTDMVCFSHFKPYYSNFKSLTRYPKFIGNCPGGCNFHYHPSDIFFAMNKGRSAQEPHLIFFDKFIEAIETI